MATRTFVGDGASHNWSATGAWVEGIVPTAADDIVFSTNTAGSILVIDGTSGSPSLCRSIDTTNYTRTITFGASKQLNVGDGTTGAFKMTAGMTFAPSGTSLVKFASTTTGNNITFAGYSFGDITFDGVSGSWQLQDAPGTGNPSRTWTLTNGSLDTNGKNISALFSSSNSNTRSLTLGATNWNIGTFNSVAWDIGTSTGMTLSAASSTITWGATAGTGPAFNGGGLTYGTLTSTTNQNAIMSITGANTFGTLTLSMGSGTPANTTGFRFSANQTVTGTFTSAGNSLTDRSFLYSDTQGTARTISAATFAITNADLRDITKAGAGSGDISATSSTSGNGDCGGNTGWTFQAPRSVYMKTAVSVNWSANNWKTTSGGVTAATPPIPLCHDTGAVFDANSVTAGSKIITLDMPRIPSVNWTGVLNTPAFATGSSTFESYGNFVLVSGMTHTGTGFLVLSGRSSYSFDGGTLTWPTSSTLQLNAIGGTYTLARAFTSNDGLTTVVGTLANGGFASTFTAITVQGGTVSGTGAITGTTYTQTGGTNTLGGTLTLTGANAISGGTLDLNGNSVTGGTTLAVSGSGVLNLSGQMTQSSTITVSGGTVSDAGILGELKSTGANLITFSGGISTVRKITQGGASNIVISGTGNLTIPAGGSATWTSGIFEVSSNTASLTIDGIPSFTNGALSIVGRNLTV